MRDRYLEWIEVTFEENPAPHATACYLHATLLIRALEKLFESCTSFESVFKSNSYVDFTLKCVL